MCSGPIHSSLVARVHEKKKKEWDSCSEVQSPTCLHSRMKGRHQKDRVPIPTSQLHVSFLPFTMKTALCHAMHKAKGY